MAEDDYKEPLGEDEIMAKINHWREDGISGSENRFERMRKSEDFTIGRNQWDPATKERNRLKGKFSLTVPIIKPQINSVTGNHIQNPQEFKVRPLRSGSATMAQLLTSLAKHATDSEHYVFQESQQFQSGVTSGEGNMLFGLDWTDDPKHANLTIQKLNEHECLWDPSADTYDPNHRRQGAKFFFWEPWEDKDLINTEFPDKREVLAAQSSGVGSSGLVMGAVSGIINWLSGGTTGRTISAFGSTEREDTLIADKYRYKITHCWWRWPKKCIMLYDSRKSELDAMLLVKDDDIKKAKELADKFPEYEAIEVIKHIMHHTRACGSVYLDDKIDELNGCQMYPVSRYNAYFVNGYASGVSEDLIGTQEIINFSYSQELNILKKMPNSGVIINSDNSGGKYKRWLEEHLGEDGIVLERDKAGGSIEFKDPTQFPVGFHAITETAMEHAKAITGIRMEDPTTDKDRVASTVALKQKAADRDQAVIHHNWNYTQSIAGNLLVEIIRFNQIYSEDEINEIVDEDELIDKLYMEQARQMVVQLLSEQGVEIPASTPEIQVGNFQELDPNLQQATVDQYQEDVAMMQEIQQQIDQIAAPIAQQMLIDDIRDIKKGKYNTKVTLSPAAQTARMSRYFELTDLNKALMEGNQLPIGRRFLIEATDLPNKDEIIAEGEQKMEMMAGAQA